MINYEKKHRGRETLILVSKKQYLLSEAAILRSSSISVETSCRTPSEFKTSFFRNWTFSSDKDCNRFAPLAMVLATSNANIHILFPLEDTPVVNPPEFKLVMLLPRVSKTSTAFSRPTMPAFPRNDVI